MNTPMIYKIAPMMNRAGFRAIDTISISQMGFAVRHHRENPWERIRLLSQAIPNTPLSIMMPGNSIAIFKITPGPVMALFMKRLAANGIRRVQMTTVRGDISNGVRYARDAGLEVVIALAYTLSPLHTDEYYEREVRDALKLSPDGIYIKDAGGLLTPDRVRTLVPALQRHLEGLPLEIHSHCTTGLAPLCYLEAMKLGVKTFHTAISPLANGSSQPSIENILRNGRSLGYSSNVDKQALEAIATHFREVARTEGFPIGVPLEYDVGQYAHQVPGGVISNLRRQLGELGVAHRLGEVLKETALVRKEFGYPIMITPYSQFVVTQAMLNVIQGERYKTITDEVIQFALGHYGKQPVPVDQDLMERINSLPRTKDFKNWQPEEISIEDMRRQFGSDLTDDELLLLVLCSEEDLKAMRNAGPIKTEYAYSGGTGSVRGLIRELTKLKETGYINIQKENFSLTLGKSTKRNKRGQKGKEADRNDY